MSAKVINLTDFQIKNNLIEVNKKNSENKYVNKYKEVLRKMTKEEILTIEELLEN